MFVRMKIWSFVAVITLFLIISCGDESTQGDTMTYTEPALVKINEEIEKSPQDADLYYERGSILDRLERDSLALIDYKKAISLDSTRAEYYSAIGDMLFEHKDIEGSTVWLEKALALNPEDKKAHLKLAKLFLYIEQYTKAFSEINIVLRQDVYNPEGYYLKGMIYKNLNDTNKAISSFQTALQVEPKYREAMVQLGIMYSKKGDPLALKYYDNAYQLDTMDVFPVYAKGVYHQDLGNYEMAKQFYRETINLDNQYVNAYFNMGYVYMQQDSIEKAYRHYDIVTRIYPQDPEGYFNRGLCNELLGKKEEAIKDYKQALVFDEDYKDPKEGLKRLGA